jgi:hypothetical protein
MFYIVIVYNTTGQPEEVMRQFCLLLIAVLLAFTAQSIGESVSAIWMNNQNAAVFAGGIIPLPMILFGGFLVKVSRMPVYLQPLSWFSFLRFAFEAMLVTCYGFQRCDYAYEQFLRNVNASAITKPLWAQYLPFMLDFIDAKKEEEEFEDGVVLNVEKNVSAIDRLYSIFIGRFVRGENEFSFEKSFMLTYYEINDFHFIRAIAILVLYMVVLKVFTYFVLLAKLHSKK